MKEPLKRLLNPHGVASEVTRHPNHYKTSPHTTTNFSYDQLRTAYRLNNKQMFTKLIARSAPGATSEKLAELSPPEKSSQKWL